MTIKIIFKYLIYWVKQSQSTLHAENIKYLII